MSYASFHFSPASLSLLPSSGIYILISLASRWQGGSLKPGSMSVPDLPHHHLLSPKDATSEEGPHMIQICTSSCKRTKFSFWIWAHVSLHRSEKIESWVLFPAFSSTPWVTFGKNYIWPFGHNFAFCCIKTRLLVKQPLWMSFLTFLGCFITVPSMQLRIHFVLKGVSYRPSQLDLILRKRLSYAAPSWTFGSSAGILQLLREKSLAFICYPDPKTGLS